MADPTVSRTIQGFLYLFVVLAVVCWTIGVAVPSMGSILLGWLFYLGWLIPYLNGFFDNKEVGGGE